MPPDPTAGGGTEGLRDDDMPSPEETAAMWEEVANFRNPTPPPIPVRGRYYITECERCAWVGSSEQCGGGDEDVVCPVCCSSIIEDEPNEADIAKHGEAVMQRILTAEAALARASAEQARVEAERDEREAWAAAWHRVVETTLILMDLSPALGGDEAASAVQAKLASLTAERDRLRAAMALAAGRLDVAAERMTWGITAFGVREWAKEARAALREPQPTPEDPDA